MYKTVYPTLAKFAKFAKFTQNLPFASLASPRKMVWRMSASLASPSKPGWRMLMNLASPTHFQKGSFRRVLEFNKFAVEWPLLRWNAMNGLLLSKISSEKLLYLDLQFLQLLDFPVRSSKSPDFDFHFFQSFSNLRAFRRLRSIQLKKIQNNYILLFWKAKSSKYQKFHWTKHEMTK